jgi:hypothetical protein
MSEQLTALKELAAFVEIVAWTLRQDLPAIIAVFFYSSIRDGMA